MFIWEQILNTINYGGFDHSLELIIEALEKS